MSSARVPHLGFYLQTCDRPGTAARHRIAGPRREHPDVDFPRCPVCDVKTSPIYRIDFDDARLVPLALWRGVFVAMRCQNGCMARGAPTWWAYASPMEPAIEPFATDAPPVHIDDWEFEGDAVELEPRLVVPRDTFDQRSRVGGEPCRLGQPDPDVIAKLTGAPLREEDSDNPKCIDCGRTMPLLVQWSEVGMAHVPNGRSAAGRVSQLLQPGLTAWFGCADCSRVASLEDPG